MRSIIHKAVVLSVLAVCGCGFARPRIVVQPDAPVLVVGASGGRVLVAAYQREELRMVEVGWVQLTDYVGWTLTRFDWAARIEKDRNSERDAKPDGGANP